MWIADGWKDFQVLDASRGEKLERWGNYTFVRPDPQVIWNTPRRHPAWDRPSASYSRSSSGGGHWNGAEIPMFQIGYRDLTFQIKPTSFKHTGLFPEQAVNWDWARERIRESGRAQPKVLNLFAYTGGASVACAKEGARVCHVDASKGIVAWAKENAQACGLDNIRYIVDDCVKFVQREIRRGNRYDGLILDPPSYGRGPDGEVWKLESELYGLLDLCVQVLNDDPMFLILNSYTTGLSAGCMEYMLGCTVARRFGGTVTASEIGLPVGDTGYCLPCGATARWTK
ncbi:MAG: class I SAM-dependent methyltransferase [Clostridia bacterium]|nr:class I SAM-dependent methyltransferase [Clostridia bacterium]